MSVRKWPVVGVLLAVLWLFVRGVDLAPATVAGEFIIGLAVGLPIAYTTRGLYTTEVALLRDVRVLPTATWYLVLFVREVVVANVDVAYRVISPSMPIEPDVVEIPLRVTTDAAITTIANSITLTPGTLTMDYDAEINTLYVHGIVGRRRDALVAPIRRWEDLLLVIFQEDASPGDPPPTVERGPATGADPDGGRRSAGAVGGDGASVEGSDDAPAGGVDDARGGDDGGR